MKSVEKKFEIDTKIIDKAVEKAGAKNCIVIMQDGKGEMKSSYHWEDKGIGDLVEVFSNIAQHLTPRFIAYQLSREQEFVKKAAKKSTKKVAKKAVKKAVKKVAAKKTTKK